MTATLELLLADGRTPSGSYAHSGGLEPADLAPAEVSGFMRARLITVGRVDAGFAAAACAAGLDLTQLLSLDAEYAARTPAEPLRNAARSLGRGLLRTASVWFPDNPALEAYRSASLLTPRPIAIGLVASLGGLDPVGAARASLYDDAATVAAAAVKLMPLDAAVSTGWVLNLSELIETLAATAPDGLASTATPLLDMRAVNHAATDRRLFAS